ncbi:MAG TPA: hypothetical protein VEH29_06240 [Acidimicrobiales bacterium]|nr:hypothetical protein [Acidimicrobiales bacterium]
MRYTQVLGVDDHVPDRPFTNPEGTRADARVMGRMLDRLRSEAPSLRRGRLPVERHEPDQDGNLHWIVVPRPAALLSAGELTTVGFFGDLRSGVDHADIYQLEELVVARLARYAASGLLCYYDAELEPGVHGNLVLFSGSGVPDEWHADAVHARAVALAPRHYRCVRLHRAAVHGAFLGDDPLVVEQTRYFDFTDRPAWTAIRPLAM